MSTTFKDGLREAMAKEAVLAKGYGVAEGLRCRRPYNPDTEQSVAYCVAQAALAYCDQWEEVEGGWADTHSPRSGRGTILVRKAPVPTRAERVEAAVREANEANAAFYDAACSGALEPFRVARVRVQRANAALAAAAKEDR